MQGEAGVIHHRHEELLDQLGVVAADLLGRDHQAVAEVGPAGAIEGHLHQGLIEGRHKVAEAVDAAAIAQGLGQGLADGNPHVLVRVVVVDVGVTVGADLQVDKAVAGELVEHVIEEGHACGHLATAAAIEVEPHAHIGFAGDAMDRSDPVSDAARVGAPALGFTARLVHT